MMIQNKVTEANKTGHANTGTSFFSNVQNMKRQFKQWLIVRTAKWLRNQTEPNGRQIDNIDLHFVLDNWLDLQVQEQDKLSIGFVKCNNCGFRWEALAYSSTVKKLECPECGKQDSKVLGASIDDALAKED